jgi:transaldolase
MAAGGADAEEVLGVFARAGVEEKALATQLQREGAESFSMSWSDLMDVIAARSAALVKRLSGGGARS